MRKRKRKALNITVLIEGVALLFAGVGSIVEGIRLIGIKGVGQIDVFGPGRYSVIIGFGLTIFGLIYVILNHRNPREERLETKPEMKMKMFNMIVCLVVYFFLITILGYFLASMIFFFLIFRIAGFRSWPIIVGVSIGTSVSFYLVFVYLLDMMFPSGLLFK